MRFNLLFAGSNVSLLWTGQNILYVDFTYVPNAVTFHIYIECSHAKGREILHFEFQNSRSIMNKITQYHVNITMCYMFFLYKVRQVRFFF